MNDDPHDPSCCSGPCSYCEAQEMARWATHQVDGNAAELYKAAEKLGFSVEKVDTPIDSLWGIYDQTIAVEIKLPKGTLEPKQVTFFKRFKGCKRIIRTESDVIALYREMRERHDRLFPPAP